MRSSLTSSIFLLYLSLGPARMTLSWVLKSVPVKQARNLLRCGLSSQPGFYWPTNLPADRDNGENGGRSFSTKPVETTFSDSKFYTHVTVKEDGLGMLEAIDQSVGHVLSDVDSDSVTLPEQVQRFTPRQLLLLGSIWYMPKDEVEHNNNRSPEEPHSLIYKPQRLSITNHTMSLQAGDYLRIHHEPRRYTRVYKENWKEHNDVPSDSTSDNSGAARPQRIVHSGNGFYVVDKPPLVPVHATVDNELENVVHQIEVSNPHLDYVATTQRIDINTSGLLVVATKPEFAAYFSSLLRRKTKTTLKQGKREEHTANQTEDVAFNSSNRVSEERSNIEKEYKCLVCIKDTVSSTVDSWQTLKDLEDTVVRHYLQASERAPKRFEVSPLDESDDENARKWYECLLKVRRVSPLVPIETPDCQLAQSLWTDQVTTSIPQGTRAVCEVGIQLLTGRTHQIRGQLAKLGYPIVGDEQYGGATPKDGEESGKMGDFTQLLALQCCQLGFWDADYKEVWNRKRKRDILQGFPSDRWVSTTLDSAWWTEYIRASMGSEESASTTSAADVELLRQQKEEQSRRLSNSEDDEFANARVDLLPPTVQLSPGINKYVLIHVDGKDKESYWFVKSASPGECGGPYHANVAEDTIEWILSAGFKRITVTGGGRIDFDPSAGRAHVYGFSYGFGKGDHAKVAKLIDAFYEGKATKVEASFDDSNKLY